MVLFCIRQLMSLGHRIVYGSYLQYFHVCNAFLLREYLESFGIPVPDEFFKKWQQAILEMGNIIRKIEKTVSKENMEQVWTAAFLGIYLHYETKKDFMPKFDVNIQKFFDVMDLAFSEGGDKPVI